MNNQKLKSYINSYKEQFDFVNQNEIYKWKAVKQFQENWDIDASDFYGMLEKSLSLVTNLLASGQYFPKRMLLKNAKETPKKVRLLFKYLFDEEYDILERIELFRSDFKRLNTDNFNDLNDYQDHRAVVVYLALRYPERYYFYKYKMFKKFADKIDYPYTPIAGRIENVSHYNNLCNIIRPTLAKDQELIKLHSNRISDDCYYDESLNILTQDFIYAIVRHIKPQDESNRLESNEFINPVSINTKEVSNKDNDIDFTPRNTNHIQNNIENKRSGDLGEIWVVKQEKLKLENAQKPNLAKQIKHIAQDKGDGLGYDILSFDEDGTQIYIEVKTTKGNANSTFYITRNELEKSKIEKENYRLYRVYNYGTENNKAELLILKGDLSNLCKFPLIYKVTMENE